MPEKEHHEWHKQKHEKHKRLFVFSAVLAVVVIVFAAVIVVMQEKKYFEDAINCNKPYGGIFDLKKSLSELENILENPYEHERDIKGALNTVVVEKVRNIGWRDAEITAQISITMPGEIAERLKSNNLKLFQTSTGTTFLLDHKFKAQEEKKFEYSFDRKLAQEEIDSIKFSITGNSLLPFSREKALEEFNQGVMDGGMGCVNKAILSCEDAYLESGKEKIEIKGQTEDGLCSLDYSADERRYSCEVPFRAYPGRWNADEILRFCREETQYTGKVTLA